MFLKAGTAEKYPWKNKKIEIRSECGGYDKIESQWLQYLIITCTAVLYEYVSQLSAEKHMDQISDSTYVQHCERKQLF